MGTLPSALESHFATFVVIDVPQLAALFPMDRKTIKRHIDAGRLPSRFKGCGRNKPRRVFTRADIERFLEAPEQYSDPPPTMNMRVREPRRRPSLIILNRNN